MLSSSRKSATAREQARGAPARTPVGPWSRRPGLGHREWQDRRRPFVDGTPNAGSGEPACTRSVIRATRSGRRGWETADQTRPDVRRRRAGYLSAAMPLPAAFRGEAAGQASGPAASVCSCRSRRHRMGRTADKPPRSGHCAGSTRQNAGGSGTRGQKRPRAGGMCGTKPPGLLSRERRGRHATGAGLQPNSSATASANTSVWRSTSASVVAGHMSAML